ncbi:hypothetical protein ANN_01529, partial [Periplaneta americana]
LEEVPISSRPISMVGVTPLNMDVIPDEEDDLAMAPPNGQVNSNANSNGTLERNMVKLDLNGETSFYGRLGVEGVTLVQSRLHLVTITSAGSRPHTTLLLSPSLQASPGSARAFTRIHFAKTFISYSVGVRLTTSIRRASRDLQIRTSTIHKAFPKRFKFYPYKVLNLLHKITRQEKRTNFFVLASDDTECEDHVVISRRGSLIMSSMLDGRSHQLLLPLHEEAGEAARTPEENPNWNPTKRPSISLTNYGNNVIMFDSTIVDNSSREDDVLKILNKAGHVVMQKSQSQRPAQWPSPWAASALHRTGLHSLARNKLVTSSHWPGRTACVAVLCGGLVSRNLLFYQ